ncbi:hypothetical protein [Streptomyces sp. NPDC002403]
MTGSFLVGACNARSGIDLVCYGPRGYEAAQALFAERALIHPYEGEEVPRLQGHGPAPLWAWDDLG